VLYVPYSREARFSGTARPRHAGLSCLALQWESGVVPITRGADHKECRGRLLFSYLVRGNYIVSAVLSVAQSMALQQGLQALKAVLGSW
jgi:hypothetical protein